MLSTIKAAFSGISKTVWFLAVAMLINRCGTMVVVFMTVYATKKLNFSVEQAGSIMSMFGLGSLIGVLIGGKLTDKIGYYKVMVGSLFIGGIHFFILAQLTDFYYILICIFFVSLFGEAFRPANMAAIASLSKPENFTRSLSLNRLAVNLGFSIGPALGGFMAASSYKSLFYADGMTCILSALIIAFSIKQIKTKKENTNEKLVESTSPYRDMPYMFFTFMGILYATAFFQMFSTMPLYYKDVHHLSEQKIGLLMALNGISVAAIEMVLIYKIENKLQPLQFAVLGSIMLMLNYIVLLFASNYLWLVLSMLFITVSEMLAMPFMTTFMIKRAGENKKGSYASVYSMTWSIAQIISPIIATQTIAKFGHDILWMIFILFGVLISLGMYYLHQYTTKIEAAKL
ncbi:MAG TPA: MFS transporter [Bacteroidia bacterium]|nr:MFS transporter [Bacteroidia bacterium]